jgi:hypothetical protein
MVKQNLKIISNYFNSIQFDKKYLKSINFIQVIKFVLIDLHIIDLQAFILLI